MNDTEYCIAIIKPKQPYLDWLMSLPDPPEDVTLEDARKDCTSVLIPEFPDNESALKFVLANYESIFRNELECWDGDESLWPSERTKELFLEWFDVEIHSMVYDLTDDDLSL